MQQNVTDATTASKRQKVITKAEYKKIEKAEDLRDQAVQVDYFDPKAYKDMR